MFHITQHPLHRFFGEKIRASFTVLFVCFFLAGSVATSVAEDKPTVFVSILPQKYFVEQIAGDLVKVEVMVKPGASPATYEPKVSQMKQLASCAIYFAIGVPFERAWLDRIAGVNPQMQIVRTDQGIEKLSMEKHLHGDEDHGVHEGHEDHDGHKDQVDKGDKEEAYLHEEGLDPHIWLSPLLVQRQAAIIAASLTELLPDQATFFDANHKAFQARLVKLDKELRQILAGKKGYRFMVFHPSWGYFAHNYQLVQVPIEIEGKGPKSSQLKELILFARKEGIQVIFAQPQFSTKSAALVAREIDGEVITVDPLAENWLDNMKSVAEKFRDAIQ
ncbi:metal ABC transporter solute-binding protein, Zn/Mn family [Desulforhopalus sp. IMCC35007]|uniref:metal ABC transporter solute-binding protein, Zn/Mn family n=1 Tax=Desulforhopalus sp. IMCC35007 TaxID=2569543 RepID=UPI001F0E10FF|nr:zinc ABC transporter substrate-binding protein [Desulforhopalus sp. IMCC35007]